MTTCTYICCTCTYVCVQVVAIEGDFEVNGDPQSKFSDILPEIVISRYNYYTAGIIKVVVTYLHIVMFQES